MDKGVLKFVIVGHLDHGKSTLIGRLLYDTETLPYDKVEEIKRVSREMGRNTEFAYLLDHLEEERRQEMTIDTTQAFFKTGKRQYVIIDAPGHAELVRNMITGASQADAAVLIIDIHTGIEEQTRRHAYILSFLGIKQIIVVLNKMDLIDYREDRFKAISNETEDFLDSVGIRALFYIPISAINGENVIQASRKMDWYKGPAFLESLDMLKSMEMPENKPLIFPVQDVYKIDEKRMVVGRVEAGVLEEGAKLRILPEGKITTVSSIEKYPEAELKRAPAGQCIGINTCESVFIERGNIFCLLGEEPVLTDEFCANVIWMAERELKKSERITIRYATQERICQIKEIKRKINSSTLEVVQENADALQNLEVGEVVIRTDSPLVVKSFSDIHALGRFVFVRDDNICAGGTVTG